MARAPSKVSATSGQGVSRKSYQSARSMGQRGTGSPMGGTPRMETGASRSYGKDNTYKPPKEGAININYGDTLPISDLQDLKAIKGRGPMKGLVPSKPMGSVSMKSPKGTGLKGFK